MLTPTAEWLIGALQHDPKVAKHFSISDWDGKGTCGTVGCIAGTAVAHYYGLRDKDNLQREYFRVVGNNCGDYVTVAAEILGLDYATARHLFVPRRWATPLQNGENPFDHLSQQQRPSRERVDLMRLFAQYWDTDSVTAPQAGRALKSILVDEIPYVDWRRAVMEDV